MSDDVFSPENGCLEWSLRSVSEQTWKLLSVLPITEISEKTVLVTSRWIWLLRLEQTRNYFIIIASYMLCGHKWNVPHHWSEVCAAGLDFQSIFPQTDDKISSASLCSDYLKHALLAICIGEDSGPYAGCAVHSYHTWVSLERAYVQIATDCGWRTSAIGRCCQVCELRTADQVANYTWQSLLQSTALPIDGLYLVMGLPVDYDHGKIRSESL